MVGQFNEHVVEAVRDQLDGAPAAPKFWVVGERVQARLETAGYRIDRTFPTPQSIEAIAPLVSELLFEIEADYIGAGVGEVIVHHNAPLTRSNYKTACVRLLPLDQSWRTKLMKVPWPESRLPEMIDCSEASRTSLISEFLFVSLYQACTASCSAENAARLAAMQRAEKNIDDRRSALDLDYNHQRQSMIDEELFELICGFEALTQPAR
jgi:F-type H+-transporting ATPase subunit gamma